MKRTNIEINENLMEEALKLTHLSTQKEVVNLALENLIKSMNRRKMAELRGKVKWEGNLDEMRYDQESNWQTCCVDVERWKAVEKLRTSVFPLNISFKIYIP